MAPYTGVVTVGATDAPRLYSSGSLVDGLAADRGGDA